MPTPSEATVQDQISRLADILIWTMEEGGTASPNLIDKVADLVPEGDYNEDLTRSLQTAIRSMEGVARSIPPALDACLKSYKDIMGTVEVDGAAILRRLYKWAIDNGITVESREFTWGTPAYTTGNQGDGQIYRLTEDAYGYDIESATPEVKVARCIKDRYSGADSLGGEEVFRLEGKPANPSILKAGLGSNIKLEPRGKTGRDTQLLLLNPSFSAFQGDAAAPDSFDGWTLATGTLPVADQATDHQFRTYRGEGTPTALKVTDDFKFTQDLTVRLAKLKPDTPYFWRIAWNREIGSGVAATGATIYLRLGNTEVSAPFSSETGWQKLLCPFDMGNWFRNFNKETLNYEIEVVGLGGGYLLIDDAMLVEMDRADSTYLTIDGGQTPFAFEDEASWEDTTADNKAKNQRLFVYTKNLYLPAGTGASGSPISWPDAA